MLTIRSAAVATAAVLGLSTLSACGQDASSSATESETLDVVAAFYPLEFLAERVGGDAVTVTSLTTPGQEAHDLELGVQQTAELSEADLVVHLANFQPAVDEAVEQNGPDRVIDAAEHADLLAVGESAAEHDDHSGEDEHTDEEGHSDEDDHSDEGEHTDEEGHSDEEGHDHGSEDPHFWLDPVRMGAVASAIETQLSEADPDNAEMYAENLATLQAELDDLAEEMDKGLASCDTDTIVVSHDAFSYLGEYGLEIASIAGLSPDAEPSPARLAELREVIADEGVTTVFYETLVSPALAETLAEEAGVETAVLDPIEGLTDETQDEDYLSLMSQNLETLRTANGCS